MDYCSRRIPKKMVSTEDFTDDPLLMEVIQKSLEEFYSSDYSEEENNSYDSAFDVD